jgi:hypothetical protein
MILTPSHKSVANPPDPLSPEEQHGEPSKLSKSVDKSEALFTMYLDRSGEDDRKTTQRWKGECDAILIFVSSILSTLSPSRTFMLMLAYRRVFSLPLLQLFFINIKQLSPGKEVGA